MASGVEWTRKFVIENLGLLLSSDDRTDAIKLKKKEFFHRTPVSHSFSLKDLAIETVKHLMNLQRIRTEDDLRKYVRTSSFLSGYLTEHQIGALVGLIRPVRLEILTSEDLGKLGQEKFVQEKEQEFFQKALEIAEKKLEKDRAQAMEEVSRERQHLEELRRSAEEQRKSAEQRLEEVRNVESLLDSFAASVDPESYVVADEDKMENRKFATWWQKIGLVGDPFPTKLGLNLIPVEKYEKIVVRTRMFQEYLSIINDAPQSFYGKTILITGQFGSGKTTFMEYISYKLADYKILPFQLVLDPVGDIDSLRQNFYSDIFNLTSKAMKQRGLADPRPEGLSLERSTIADLLSLLSKEAQIDGYAIMLDGLHKAESTLDTSLEFVKQLQNFHEYLNNCGVKVTIFVAGSPYWSRKITQNPAFSGSFYRIDDVPPLTFDDAYELLQKRFTAFADQNIPIFFEKSTVRFAYDCIAADFGFVTFRAFIDYILPKLEKGDLKEVGVSVSVDIEDAQKIDEKLSASVIKDFYSLFRKATARKKRLRRSCANILRAIYKRTCLVESEQQFLTNRGAVYVLRNSHLIQKLRTPKGVGWSFSSEFLAVLEDLNEQGYPPAIVFQTFSIDPTVTLKKDVKDDPLIIQAQNFLAKWESEWPEIVTSLKSFLEKNERIIEYCSTGANTEICGDCRNALLNLVESGQLIFKNTQSPEEWLRSTWLDIPILPVVIPLLQQETLADTEAVEYYQRYRQCASVLLEKLEQLLAVNSIAGLTSSSNRTEEMRALFKASTHLDDGELDKAVEDINSYLEKRIRVAFHLTFSLQFGPDYFRYVPESAQRRITELSNKAPFPLKRAVDKNLFYHLTRSEYTEVINSKSNWNSIFQQVFFPKSREEVAEAVRLTFALDDRIQHRDRIDYFRERKEQLRQAIVNAEWLFKTLANVISLTINPKGFCEETLNDYHTVRISLVGQNECGSAYPWRIHAVKEKDIASRLTRMSRIVNASDDNGISTLFNGAFAEVFIVIALLLKKGLIKIQFLQEGNMYFRIIPTQSN